MLKIQSGALVNYKNTLPLRLISIPISNHWSITHESLATDKPLIIHVHYACLFSRAN